MKKKRGTSSDNYVKPELLVSREAARYRLYDRIEKGRELRNATILTPEQLEIARTSYRKWDAFNCELLKRIFTTEELAYEYNAWNSISFMSTHIPSLGEEISDLLNNIDGRIHNIDSIIERIELIPVSGLGGAHVAGSSSESAETTSSKVFIVHGHDELAKTSLEVFLLELGMEPVVLHRQADEGLTVIEKFEKHSDVGYAFILLTPDEVSYLQADELKSDQERAKEKRARPNVIFEFGYFVGKLGRSRVCCLHTGDVTLPSDVNGMIYKRYVSSVEEVAFSIIKDLKASGYRVSVA